MSSVQKLGVPVLFFYNTCCIWFIKIVKREGIYLYINGKLEAMLKIAQPMNTADGWTALPSYPVYDVVANGAPIGRDGL